MGVSELLARWATKRVSVLIVETPGWSRARCAVEAELRRRGWRAALSPADADALVICGQPGPRLQAAVDLVWEQLPGPRARATVNTASAAQVALDDIHAALADDTWQRRDAAARPTGPAMGTPARGEDEDASGMGHGHMDHGDMHMPMPGGIPLASGAEDRDGLEMDVLHVPLGPVLPAWPAGLLLRCTLAGDVVTDAEADVLEPAGRVPPGESLVQGSAPERLDRAARLLTLAGWGQAATSAARLRDELLDTDSATLLPEVDRLVARVGRSLPLRWSISGRGRSERFDAYGRLLAVLHDAGATLAGGPTPLLPTALEELPGLVIGRQLPSVRLLVAGAELDTATIVRAGTGLP